MKPSNHQAVKPFRRPLCIVHYALCISFAAVCSAANEPICWTDGTWDESGAPEGRLLTDNTGWWGRCVFTGVTYSYGTEPDSPRDIFKNDKGTYGRRLLDGNASTGWHRPVGLTKQRPIAVHFDFKRPCVFNEVDLMSEKSPQAEASLSVSTDGTNWTVFAEAACTNALTRVRPATPGAGRYLRISYHSKNSSTTYLDEVLVWGEGEVSEAFPENIRPIPRGDLLRMACATNGVVEWVPLQDPTAKSKEQFGQPMISFAPDAQAGGEILLARNETETRYFAVANGSTGTVSVALSASGFGDGIRAELLIGGLVRTQKPKYKLTEKQRFDMLLTGDEPEEAFDADRLGIIPFFTPDMVPPENFARKYLGNPEQVADFPERLKIEPGECAVVMLRLTTDAAEPGERTGTLSAAWTSEVESSKLKVESSVARVASNRPTVQPSNCQTDTKTTRAVAVRVVDATLPDAGRIYVWGPFTPQFPFESATRFENDVRAFCDLGASMLPGFPKEGTKVEMASRGRRDTMFFRASGIGSRLDGLIYNRKLPALDDQARADITNQLTKVRADAKACGVRPEQVFLTLVDEPGPGNAKICGEVCRFIREVAPDFNIYLNPSFWMRSHFAPAEDIIAALGDFYADCVDVSVPYRSLVESEKGRKALWATPRRVNMQYAHPAHRAGRSISWSSFRYGLDGFAYWCYFWKTGGTPWDIRTWRIYAYEADLVLPLENGVAFTPIYDEMREAWEDWRILTALKKAGKTEILDALLKEFGDSFDEPNMETSKPYSCDFQMLRDKALGAFCGADSR